MKGFDEICPCHIPINRIESISARSKFPLSVDREIGKLFDQGFNQTNAIGAEAAGGNKSEVWESISDRLCERNEANRIHPKPSSHALVEKHAMDHPFVITETFDDPLWIRVDFLQCIFSDLKNDFDLFS